MLELFNYYRHTVPFSLVIKRLREQGPSDYSVSSRFKLTSFVNDLVPFCRRRERMVGECFVCSHPGLLCKIRSLYYSRNYLYFISDLESI